MIKIKRTHDKFYLKENRKNKPKESFKFILRKINYTLNNKRILDIGSATGDFLYYLSYKYPRSNLFGMDVDKDLINYALKSVPKVEKIFKHDISKKNNKIGKFDVIFMIGVHSIFDDCMRWLPNVISLLCDKQSKAYIFGIWNDDDIDVILRMKKSDNLNNWETGWNIFSKTTIKKCLHKLKVKHKFYDFNLDIDIKKNKKDPLRSWTLDLKNNKKIVVNGACILHKFSLLEISK